jgi:predicted AAA+ superfamily ATPase
VGSWLGTLQRICTVFSLSPWSRGEPRAIREGQKVYLADVPRVKDAAARFENAVAIELLRAVTSWTELGFGRFSLHFVRTKDQQEVDFLLVEDGRPVLLVDAALEAQQPSPALIKFQDALKVPAVQLVGAAEGYRRIPNDGQTIVVAPACQYLSGLP